MKPLLIAVVGSLACTTSAGLLAQSASTVSVQPQRQLPNADWVVVEDVDGSEQSLTASKPTGPMVVPGAGPHVIVDRRWVLTPPYRVSARLQLAPNGAGGLMLGLLPSLETGRTGTAWIARADGAVALEQRLNGDVISRQVRRVPQTGNPWTVTLTADVSTTAVAFAIDELPIFTTQLSAISSDGSPAVWLSGTGNRLDSFELTTPPSANETVVMP